LCDYCYALNTAIALSAASLIHAGKMQATQEGFYCYSCIYCYTQFRYYYYMMNSCDCDYWYTYNIALSAASLIHAGKMQATQERLDCCSCIYGY